MFSLTKRKAQLQLSQTYGGIGKGAGCLNTIANLPRNSYHDFGAHISEMRRSYPYTSRGFMRYDAHTRRYKHWYLQEDWTGRNAGPNDVPNYPRFTQEEGRQILRRIYNGRRVDPLTMGKDWNFQGPNVRNHLMDTEEDPTADFIIEI
jgi:hypothetical protein